MASIIILGNGSLLPAFARSITSGFTVHTFDTADGAAPAFPADLVAIVDLEIDREPKLAALASLGPLPQGVVLFTNTLTITATEVAARCQCSGAVVGISYVPHLYAGGAPIEAAPALGLSDADADAALELLGGLAGRATERLVDRVGLVAMRTLAMIINEAAFALMEGVAAAGDIDVAMKLGTNYPQGPLAWADAIGPQTVVAVLQALHDEYQEERYRPCVLLKQHARARLPFHTAAE